MKKIFNLAAAIIICSACFLVFSCEEDFTEVGNGMLDSGATANIQYLKILAYNTNNDSIRSDGKVLQTAVVGVYDEPVFGRTKARFITQARLASGSSGPDFGGNPEMDSVVLSIPVFFKNNDDDIKIDTTYLYLGEDESPSDTATVLIRRTYKLDSIYGNTTNPITLQVREVARYLYSQDSTYYSNKNLAHCQNCENINDIPVFPNILGSLSVKDTVTTYQKKKLDSGTEEVPPVVLRINLDKNYFKQKFIDNQNSPDLSDNASFIRNFFRGIELSVPENQGFIMNINPNSSNFLLTMFYSYDNPNEQEDDDEDYKPRLSRTYPLLFNGYWSSTQGYNVQVNQYEHSNRSAQFVNAYTNPDMTNGASRLYLAGLDGTKTVIEFDQTELEELKDNVQNNGLAIIGAELILHVDDSYGLKKPPFVFAWNNYEVEGKVKNENFTDLFNFFNFYPNNVQFNPKYDYENNPNTYIIRITDYFKNLVEGKEDFENTKIILSLGNFMLAPATYTDVVSVKNPFFNDRAYNPHRLVLHGNNSEQPDKRLQLKIYYTKK